MNQLSIFIDELIKSNNSFAIYRIPGEQYLNFIQQSETDPVILDDLELLNKKAGFVIAPFIINAQNPLVLITGKKEHLLWDNQDLSDKSIIYTGNTNPQPVELTYRKRFDIFIKTLHGGELNKVVLSRNNIFPRPDNFSVALSFLKACSWYIRSYVYLFHTPQTGTWLGSTPEIILSGKDENWHTVALAGTQPLKNGNLPQTWDDKNRREQLMVAQYIKSQLGTLGINSVENGPYTIRAAELAHLKTDFIFKLPNNTYLGSLLKLLHPTPAVCGLPKDKTYKFIQENEGYDRRYYSGFIGMLDWESGSDIYVNLRCMEIMQDKLCLYAGGGLLPSSTLEGEWKETEDKLFTMRKIIN